MKNIIEVVVCILLFFSLVACSAPFGKAGKAPVQKATVQVSPGTSAEQSGIPSVVIRTKEDFFALVNPYLTEKGYITLPSERHFEGHYVDEKITENTYILYDDVTIKLDEDDTTRKLKSIRIYAPSDISGQALEFFNYAKEITISVLDPDKAKDILEELNLPDISEDACKTAKGDNFLFYYTVESSLRWLQVERL